MSDRSSINLVSRRGHLTVIPGADARDFSCAVLRFLSSLSSDPSAKDVSPRGRETSVPREPSCLFVHGYPTKTERKKFMITRNLLLNGCFLRFEEYLQENIC